ncbi:MAG: M20 family metallopeptidase [Candidatus Limnocylindrales bacterium]
MPVPADAALVERARAAVDPEGLADLALKMTAIPSPTGAERELAEMVVAHLRRAGVEADIQVIDGQCANVLARLPGRGDGPRLLLYAPLDTAFAGIIAEDEPWLGATPRADFALPPRREGRKVIGLGAENPKGFAAAGIGAVEALAAAGVDSRGDVLLALAGGSMPVDRRPGLAGRVGFGQGITFLLDHAPRPDFAVVLKPGYAVAHEEVGLAWFRLTVGGAVNYTGIRHKGPYRNPILSAARLVTALEDWFPAFTAAGTSGLVAPQGSIDAIHAGSPDRVAFIPASCEIDLDLRVAPDSSPQEVQAQLEAAVATFREADPALEVSVEMTASLPGTRTDPDSWIVRSLVRAWEAREARPHVPLANGSGASDAAVLRSQGIPTARIGLPPPATPSPFTGFSMGVADIDSIAGLADLLILAIVDTTFRSRSEVGLP